MDIYIFKEQYGLIREKSIACSCKNYQQLNFFSSVKYVILYFEISIRKKQNEIMHREIISTLSS